MKPSAVTWAILGLLAMEPRSGYDLKRSIDRTIRHFWAASYGQIYPELKRLEEAGWIAVRDGGSRARRVYRATPAGRAALVDWLHGEETRIELRDESLLRLFFADTLPADEALGLLRARRDGYAQMHALLRSLDDGSGEPDPPLRRPRLSLGPRLLHMGDRMVRTAGTPLAQTQLDDLPPPTWRSLVARGVPQFAAEALLPVAAFYAGWRLSGLAAGIGVSAIVSIALAAVLIRRGREVGLVAVGAAFVVIQAVVGLVVGQRDGLPRTARRPEWVVGHRVRRFRACRSPVDRRVRVRLVPVPGVVPRERSVQARVRDAVARVGRVLLRACCLSSRAAAPRRASEHSCSPPSSPARR